MSFCHCRMHNVLCRLLFRFITGGFSRPLWRTRFPMARVKRERGDGSNSAKRTRARNLGPCMQEIFAAAEHLVFLDSAQVWWFQWLIIVGFLQQSWEIWQASFIAFNLFLVDVILRSIDITAEGQLHPLMEVSQLDVAMARGLVEWLEEVMPRGGHHPATVEAPVQSWGLGITIRQ